MAVHSVGRIVNPDGVTLRLTLEASVGDFRALRKTLESGDASWRYPVSQFRDVLVAIITKAETEFEEQVETDG